MNERHVFGLILSGGQAGNAPVGEEMLAHVLQREEVKAVSGDRAYDSDAIRQALAQANKEAVIPSRSNRTHLPDYDREKYKQRNRVERLFNRLKHFRAVATRYDKLAHMFFGWHLGCLDLHPAHIVSCEQNLERQRKSEYIILSMEHELASEH